MASNGSLNGWSRDAGESVFNQRIVRRVFWFGRRLETSDVPSLPSRYRPQFGALGWLLGVRLLRSTGDVWLRLQRGRIGLPWNRIWRIVPLNSRQSPAPEPETVDLRGGMRIACHEGYVGRLDGITINPAAGQVLELVMRVRRDVITQVNGPRSPFSALLSVAGKHVLLAPSWARTTVTEPRLLPFLPPRITLLLEASPEQIGSSALLRRDDEVAADVLAILSANPAIAPYTSRLRVSVHDGDVRLSGSLPSIRHRASAEQDVWHVPGVYTVHDDTAVHS